MRIRNTSQGIRTVNAIGGPVAFEPGQEREVELSKAEINVAKGTGWFEIDGRKTTTFDFSRGSEAPSDPEGPKTLNGQVQEAHEGADPTDPTSETETAVSDHENGSEEKDLEPSEGDQLKKQAEYVLAHADKWPAAEVKKEAEKILGFENTPTTKAEVIKALKKVAE